MRNRFVQELISQAKQDERIWLITGDLGFSVLEPFSDQFPDRFINAGIAEQNMTGVAAGLALNGKIPFIYSIANFPTLRCLEQVRNDIVYHNLPARIVAIGGGLAYGAAGYSHHAIEDLAIMRALPDLVVLAPSDPEELSEVMTLLKDVPQPAYIRLGKGGEETFTQNLAPLKLGKPRLVRSGRGVAFMATGAVTYEAYLAAGMLSKEGAIDPRVLGLCTISHLDTLELEKSLEGIHTLFLVEEHLKASAFQIVFEESYNFLMSNGIKLHRIFLDKDVRNEVGSREYLIQKFRLDAEGIVERVHSIL